MGGKKINHFTIIKLLLLCVLILCGSCSKNASNNKYILITDTIIKLWDDEEVHKKVIKWKNEVESAIRECSLHRNIKPSKLYYVRADKDKGVEYMLAGKDINGNVITND